MQNTSREYKLLRFIDEPIIVQFEDEFVLEKTPICPKAFTWRGKKYQILEEVSAWQDFNRRGRMTSNMQPAHAERAVQKGSWGVGRFNFRVSTAEGQIFDLYYDRAPQGVDNRTGRWILFAELMPINR